MKVLEVCFSPALGGLELYCLNLVGQLGEHGHHVDLWLASGSRMVEHARRLGLQPRIFAEPGYFNPLFSRRAAKLIREGGFDVLHLHRSKDLSVFAPLKHPPRVLTLQIESLLPKRDLFHRCVYHRVDRMLTITQRMRGMACQSLPLDGSKIHTLPYGVDADALWAQRGDPQAIRDELGIPSSAVLVGMVGRLEEPKGQDLLLKAFRRLIERFSSLHLMLVGEPPLEHLSYTIYLKELARELGISDRVHFTGFQAKTAPYYACLDLFVMASHCESFGLVLLEAMSQGLPIIATNAGGVPEIIADGVNGLLIPAKDEKGLSDALATLIEDESLRRRLGQQGYQDVREKFSLTKHLQALERHFDDIISMHDRPR
jgi:glycosyltransferase involved in cell wall biosynthesis